MNMTSLTSQQRAAVVLLSLDEDVACEVLKQLGPRELRLLAQAADSLGIIAPSVLEPVFSEFELALSQPLLPNSAGAYVRRLAESTLGSDAADEVFRPAAPALSSIDHIKSARSPALAELLAEEHPQVAAVILSQISGTQAAEVLLSMDPDKQGDLLSRVAALQEVPAEMVALASEALARSLASSGAMQQGAGREFDGVAFAAELLKELAPTDVERLLGSVEQSNAKLSPRIREAMFTFEDMAGLESRQLQPLMREVPSETLLIALKTASEKLRERFLASISSRAAESMREDLAALPPTRLSDVEKAQREVVEVALKMAADGRLVLPRGRGEKMV